MFVSTINRTPRAYLHAVVGAEYVLRLLPTRHAHLRQVHPPSELRPGRKAAGLDTGRRRRARLRSVLTQRPPRRRRARELPDAPREARRRGCARDRARTRIAARPRRHAARHGAGHGRRAEPAARRGQASSPCRSATIRPVVSHGAVRLVTLGFPDGDRRRVRATAAAVPRVVLAESRRSTPHCSRASSTCSTNSSASGLPWGIVTNKPGWLTDPLLAALGLDRAGELRRERRYGCRAQAAPAAAAACSGR